MPSITEQVIVILLFSLVPVSFVVALTWLIARIDYRKESGERGGGPGRGGRGTTRIPVGPASSGGWSMRAGDDDLARSA